jgi:hypothetical protein
MAGGQIVSANVGNAVAGGVVIPEPVPAGYATWPDILKKETADILAIFNDRVSRGGDDPEDDRTMQGNGPSTPVVAKAAVFGFPVIVLIAVVAFLFLRKT